MNFFKILFQPNDKKKPFYKQISLNNVIVGENGYSYGIQYSPQSFNDWLMDDNIYKIFLESTVKQLIMSNHKFLDLITAQKRLNLTLVDCEFKNIDIEDVLDGEEFDSELLKSVIEDFEYPIMKVYFRTKNRHMVTLKSNGVLGIDDDLSENELDDIKKLIDFLGFGPVMLV
ncbi:TetR family transcriptional regulator [Bacillus cereus]|uniref:TetR family transcriptional regulator n=1 Tax=Bacillus cereus TaxID=1396 RepID=UPI0027DB0DA2|nr:TetR family transcriptional regulator [Bacillus cereus]MDQ4484943.1 TetR family transcriptional regulator [Bacillus cereus]